MALGICQLCGNSKNLIDAHIIPASFWSVGSKPLAIFSDKSGSKPRKSPIGIYDSDILCDVCDNRLGKLDQYAIENLVRKPGIRTSNFNTVLKEYTPIDVRKVHDFVLSVAWRASKSKHDYYGEIILGPYEDAFLNAFQQEHPRPLEFQIFISEFNTSVLPYLQPKSVRIENVNMIAIYAGRFKIFIKTDRRPLTNAINQLQLGDGSSVFSIVESWEQSLEKKMADRVLNNNPRPRFWK